MNFSQLHEQLRLELLRRIQSGMLSGTLLARKTGLRPAHISNFLHSKRRLSLDALDRVLSAQSIAIEDLLAQTPQRRQSRKLNAVLTSHIPLISQTAAMHDSQIRMSSVSELIQLPPGYLDHLRARRSPERKRWERFVAVRASYLQAEAMVPMIAPHAILVLDRHYNSLVSYRPHMPGIYALRRGSAMLIRYAALQGSMIILRPHKIEFPVELIETTPEDPPASLVVGRVCVSIAEV